MKPNGPIHSEDGDVLPITKFRCPVHGVPETPEVIWQNGERMIRYECPVEECDHDWTVKRLRA